MVKRCESNATWNVFFLWTGHVRFGSILAADFGSQGQLCSGWGWNGRGQWELIVFRSLTALSKLFGEDADALVLLVSGVASVLKKAMGSATRDQKGKLILVLVTITKLWFDLWTIVVSQMTAPNRQINARATGPGWAGRSDSRGREWKSGRRGPSASSLQSQKLTCMDLIAFRVGLEEHYVFRIHMPLHLCDLQRKF